MNREWMVVSNNPLVRDHTSSCTWVDGNFADVLLKVRDLVYDGYKLITHPLPASIGMFYAPVRSIILAPDKSPDKSEQSMILIAEAIDQYRRTVRPDHPQKGSCVDYEMIDYDLWQQSLSECRRGNFK